MLNNVYVRLWLVLGHGSSVVRSQVWQPGGHVFESHWRRFGTLAILFTHVAQVSRGASDRYPKRMGNPRRLFKIAYMCVGPVGCVCLCACVQRWILTWCVQTHPLPLRRYSMIAMVVEVRTPVVHCEVAQAFEWPISGSRRSSVHRISLELRKHTRVHILLSCYCCCHLVYSHLLRKKTVFPKLVCSELIADMVCMKKQVGILEQSGKNFSLRNFGNSVYPALPVSFGWDTKSRWSFLSGVYARESKRSHQSALECVHNCRGLHHPL